MSDNLRNLPALFSLSRGQQYKSQVSGGGWPGEGGGGRWDWEGSDISWDVEGTGRSPTDKNSKIILKTRKPNRPPPSPTLGCST